MLVVILLILQFLLNVVWVNMIYLFLLDRMVYSYHLYAENLRSYLNSRATSRKMFFFYLREIG